MMKTANNMTLFKDVKNVNNFINYKIVINNVYITKQKTVKNTIIIYVKNVN